MSEHRKILSFGVPCYNSSSYMDRCIESILEGSNYADDVHIVIVDDGSVRDDTAEKADAWAARYPELIDVVHQENGGHGIAVLSALREAQGVYFKVVDSDDWVDAGALRELLECLRGFVLSELPVDLVITNYVYEHVADNKQNVINYRYALPKDKVMTWEDVGHFNLTQYLLMHSLCYRTDILRDGGIPMPPHTFYVDNIYSYVPLPRCQMLYYLDVDLYRYFIGREDQSVNESVMLERIDQNIRVTQIMMHAYRLFEDVSSVKLRDYMVNHFNLMMAVCSVYARISNKPKDIEACDALWAELKDYDRRMYYRASTSLMGFWTTLPTKVGKNLSVGIYRAAAKLVKFN